MSKIEESVGFYRKMSDLQEKLRRSEEERLQLEEKFTLLMRACRDEEETRLNNLRERYEAFLEEEKHRRERNDRILQTLDRIESRASILTAKSERLRLLRKHYEAYMQRMYPGWKYVNGKFIQSPPSALHSNAPSETGRPYSALSTTTSAYSTSVPNLIQNYPASNQTLLTPGAVPPVSHLYSPSASSHAYPHNQTYPIGQPYPVSQQFPVNQQYPLSQQYIPSPQYPNSHQYGISGISPLTNHGFSPSTAHPETVVIPPTLPSSKVPSINVQNSMMPATSQFLSDNRTMFRTTPSVGVADGVPTKSVAPAVESTGLQQRFPSQVRTYLPSETPVPISTEERLSFAQIKGPVQGVPNGIQQIDGYLGRAAEMLKMSNGVDNLKAKNFDRIEDSLKDQNLSEVNEYSNKHLANSIEIELEQNTSGDILNVTLSDDGILQDEPSQKLEESKNIPSRDETQLIKDGGGGGDAENLVTGATLSEKQELEQNDEKLLGAGDAFIPTQKELSKESTTNKEEKVNLSQDSTQVPVVADKMKEQGDVGEVARNAQGDSVEAKTSELQDGLGEEKIKETQGVDSQKFVEGEQQQWDESTGQYYQQEGSEYFQYGEGEYDQQYTQGEYDQQYAEGEYDQQYADQYGTYDQQYAEGGEYDQQYAEQYAAQEGYDQQYTQEEYEEYQKQYQQQQAELLAQQNASEIQPGSEAQETDTVQQDIVPPVPPEQIQQIEAGFQDKVQAAEHTEQIQEQVHQTGANHQENVQASEHTEQIQPVESTGIEPQQVINEQQNQAESVPVQESNHDIKPHEPAQEVNLPETPKKGPTEETNNKDLNVIQQYTTSESNEPIKESQIQLEDDSESSKEEIKVPEIVTSIKLPELSSDLTDPSSSSGNVEQYRQLLGVPPVGETETSDTDELEAQLAALVDPKEESQRPKEEVQQGRKESKPLTTAVVSPAVENTDTTSSENSGIVNVEAEKSLEDKPVTGGPELQSEVPLTTEPKSSKPSIPSISKPVSKKLPGLTKMLESDTESLQLDTTVSNEESDDFDFSSEK